MKRYACLLGLMLVIASLLPASGVSAAPATKSYSADRFDVLVEVQPGGELLVTETLVFRFAGGPFTYTFRNIPTDKTDGVEIVSATLDGVTLSQGAQPGQVEIQGSNPVKVTWRFAPTSDSTHTFGLIYRVRGVIRQEPGADLLRWQALPEEHDYAIARSTVQVTYPVAARVAKPQVTYGAAQVEADNGKVTFTAQNLGADEFFVFELRFAAGSLSATSPQWQAAQAQVQTRQANWGRWALPSGAVALLVFGLGLGLVLAYQKRFQMPATEALFTPNRPPSDRLPALAGVLAQRGSLQYGWDYALGAFFHLAQRGIVSIEESAESHWYRRQTFILKLYTIPADLRSHERAMLDVFFGTKKGLTREVAAHTLQNTVYQRVKRFTDTLKDETEAMRLFDPAQRRGRNVLIGWGVALMLFGPLFAVAALLILIRSAIGPWPLLIAGSLFLLGIAALIAGASISPLADSWATEVAGWLAFRKFLKAVARGRETLPYAAGFTEYLPYAAAFGLADTWANFLKRNEGVEVPAWFHGLTATHANSQMGFVAMIAAVNASGASSGASASAAAGAAAGAAGGGASGAG